MDSPENYWNLKINKRWVKRGIAAGLVLLFLYGLTVGMLCDYTDRTRTSAMISISYGVREQIGDFMLANPGKPVQLDARSLIPEILDVTSKEGEQVQIVFREITPGGELRMYSPQLGTLLVFTPKITGKNVKWVCWGRPAKKVPANCRQQAHEGRPLPGPTPTTKSGN